MGRVIDAAASAGAYARGYLKGWRTSARLVASQSAEIDALSIDIAAKDWEIMELRDTLQEALDMLNSHRFEAPRGTIRPSNN